MSSSIWSTPTLDESEKDLVVLTASLLPEPILLQSAENMAIWDLRFTSNGQYLNILSDNNRFVPGAFNNKHRMLRSRQVGEDGLRATISTLGSNGARAFSADGRLLANVEVDPVMGNAISIWDTHSGKKYGNRSLDQIPSALAFVKGGHELVSGIGNRICLQPVRSDASIRWLEGHTDRINCLDYDQTKNILASGSRDKTIRIWNDQGRELQKFTLPSKIWRVALSPDGRYLVSSSFDRVSRGQYENSLLKLWDLDTGKDVHTFPVQNPVWQVAFSPDSQLLVSASRETLQFWEVAAGKPICTLRSTRTITAVAISPNGRVLAIGTEQGEVYLGQLNHLLPVLAAIRAMQQDNQQFQRLVKVSPGKLKNIAPILAAIEAVELTQDQAIQAKKQAEALVTEVEQVAPASSQASEAQAAARNAADAAQETMQAAKPIEAIKEAVNKLLEDPLNDLDTAENQKLIEELKQRAESAQQNTAKASQKAQAEAQKAGELVKQVKKQITQDYDNWNAIRSLFHLPATTNASDPLDASDSLDNWDAIKDIFQIGTNGTESDIPNHI